MTWPTWATPLLLAALLTGLNALKPAHVDDFCYLTYAREFAAHPNRPYDFEFGIPFATPAINVLCTPALPAWLVLGMSLFGDDLFLLKLWLFPFAWLLAWSLSALCRRFAPTVSEPLTWLIVLSPGILPSFNIMLEIPVLGLQLSALVLTLHACERGRWSWIIAAGLIAGLALQMKYTAFAALGAMVLACLFERRPLFALSVSGLALGVFVGWETFVAQCHGVSHFIANFQQRREGPLGRFTHLVLPLVANLGGLMPAATLLGLAALGWSDRLLRAIAGAMVVGFLALALIPDAFALWGLAPNGKFAFSLFQTLYGGLGLAACVVMIGVIVRSRRVEVPNPLHIRFGMAHADLFLLFWLIGEIAWYFAISPFPAARRVLGVAIVATVLIGRHSGRTCAEWPRRQWLWGAAIMSAALGSMFFATDWLDANANRQAAAQAAHGEFQPETDRAAWFVDQHGFGEACHREGLKPLSLLRIRRSPATSFSFPKSPSI